MRGVSLEVVHEGPALLSVWSAREFGMPLLPIAATGPASGGEGSLRLETDSR